MIINDNVIYNPDIDYSQVTEITGFLDCEGKDTTNSFPNLEMVGGNIDCSGQETKVYFPNLKSVGGWINCWDANTTNSFSNLKSVGESINCEYTDTTNYFPALEMVGGSVNCSGEKTKTYFPNLKMVGRTISCLDADTTNSFPVLEIVGGNVNCYKQETKVLFPNLKSVGESINCWYANTTNSFPNLKSVGKNINCSGTKTKIYFPNLKLVSGVINCEDAYITNSFPVLEVASYICPDTTNVKNLFPKLKLIDPSTTNKLTRSAFKEEGFLFVDNILAKIVSTKKLSDNNTLYKIVIAGEQKETYCLEVDEVFSHGSTIKECKESLIYKISDLDTSAYKSWNLETVVSKVEAIQSYRAITGACEFGTKHFVKQLLTVKDSYSIQEVIDLTKNQYNNDVYKKFFKKKL